MNNPIIEKLSKSADLIIKLNENPMPNDCPLCDNQTNPNIGAEIFLDGTDKVVCFDCAEYHAPLLAGLITFADLSRIFQTSENNFGEKWSEKQNFRRSPMNVYQSFGVQKTS